LGTISSLLIIRFTKTIVSNLFYLMLSVGRTEVTASAGAVMEGTAGAVMEGTAGAVMEGTAGVGMVGVGIARAVVAVFTRPESCGSLFRYQMD
jgi:hypothetical protein